MRSGAVPAAWVAGFVLVLAGCTLAATAFYLLSMIAAYRFFSLSSEKKNTEAIALSPVSEGR